MDRGSSPSQARVREFEMVIDPSSTVRVCVIDALNAPLHFGIRSVGLDCHRIRGTSSIPEPTRVNPLSRSHLALSRVSVLRGKADAAENDKLYRNDHNHREWRSRNGSL